MKTLTKDDLELILACVADKRNYYNKCKSIETSKKIEELSLKLVSILIETKENNEEINNSDSFSKVLQPLEGPTMNDLIKKLATKKERLNLLNQILIPQVAKFLNEEREENEREGTVGCYRGHYILSKTTFDEYRDEEILIRLAIKELKREIKLKKYKDLQEEHPSRIGFIEFYLKTNFTYLQFMGINVSQLARDEELYSYLSEKGTIDPQEDKKKIIENIRVQITDIRRRKSW